MFRERKTFLVEAKMKRDDHLTRKETEKPKYESKKGAFDKKCFVVLFDVSRFFMCCKTYSFITLRKFVIYICC